MEEPVGTLQVAVGPLVHPERPVEVGPASGQLVEPQTHLGARHVGDGVAVAAPGRLGPDATGRGVALVVVPPRDDEVEQRARLSDRGLVAVHRMVLQVGQRDPHSLSS